MINTKRILTSTAAKACNVLQGWQRTYYNPDNGHDMIQMAGGVPVAIPMQTIDSGAPAQASH